MSNDVEIKFDSKGLGMQLSGPLTGMCKAQ